MSGDDLLEKIREVGDSRLDAKPQPLLEFYQF
jgi:hypothetical protein